ncbi:MAG: hypothetical protein OHK0037_24410 [Elainellaceae cyanobacterium]
MPSLAPPIFQTWLRHIDKHPTLKWALVAAWLAALCGLCFFWQLGSIGLVDETEPLFAEATRQMVETGDWITPYFNEKPRFDKPPLIYWLMAIAYQAIGANEWAVRLPSALSASALVIFGFFTLLRFGYSRPSLYEEGERERGREGEREREGETSEPTPSPPPPFPPTPLAPRLPRLRLHGAKPANHRLGADRRFGYAAECLRGWGAAGVFLGLCFAARFAKP